MDRAVGNLTLSRFFVWGPGSLSWDVCMFLKAIPDGGDCRRALG